MRKKKLRFGSGFHVRLGNRRAQAAEMVLSPGDSEGDPSNKHKGSDQWLFVVDGIGVAIVNDRRHRLQPGVLLLIERGDRHQIKNTGRKPLKTLNLYAPPAYRNDGSPLALGRRS